MMKWRWNWEEDSVLDMYREMISLIIEIFLEHTGLQTTITI